MLSIVLLVMVFPKKGTFKYEFQKGKPWMHEDLIAPFDFAILKSKERFEREKAELLADHHPFFRFDSVMTINTLKELPGLFKKNWNEKYKQTDSIEFRENTYNEILKLLEQILYTGIIKYPGENLLSEDPDEINLLRNNVSEQIPVGSIYTLRSAYNYINKELNNIRGIDKNVARQVLENMLIQNVFYDERTTIKEKENILNNLSLTRGMVQSGERVISKGELITNEKNQILESLKMEYESQLGLSSSYTYILIGQILLITISITVLLFFLIFFRKDIYLDLNKLFLVLLLIIFMVFVTSLVIKYDVGLLYLVPICLIPIVIRAFFDTRLALYVHIITIILIGFLVPNSFEFVFSQLIAGIIAVFSVVNLQRRSQFFLTTLMIFLTYSLVYLGLTLIQEGNLENLNTIYFALFAGSAVLTLFSYPLIFVLEKIFGLITDVTLMELSNTNTKLLRMLASKAPGTFQHSMQVANLAEEVIFEIGGNSLLVRTGALYHDIGKMKNPQYFIENQVHGFNPHDRLSFEESASVIIGHVKEGLKLARKYSLPQQIIDFIQTHHGTSRVEYFYLKELQKHPDHKIDADKYTYPGPKPFTKETAVVMMADSVEAASRSIKEPDANRIDKLVENIINKQLETDQLIYASITLREITKTKEILKKSLRSIYHVRIEYPDQEKTLS